MSALPVETTETTQSTGSVTTAASGIPASYAVPAPLVAALTRRLVTGPRPEVRPCITPLTGAVLHELPLSTRADVQVAIDHARSAQRAWARLPIEQRATIILRVHDLVLDRQGHPLGPHAPGAGLALLTHIPRPRAAARRARGSPRPLQTKKSDT